MSAAAATFHGTALRERELGTTLGGFECASSSAAKGRELWPDSYAGKLHEPERELVEGQQWRLLVGPGVVAVRYQDPARAERAAQRAVEALVGRCQCRRLLCTCEGRDVAPDGEGGSSRVIAVWSRKSRSRMVETLASLDWSTMFEGEELPAMVTLTYPGDWLAVAPHADAARRHLLLLRKRFERAWGRRLLAVWKREFQRRGAPHFHLLMVPPTTLVDGMTFREWLSVTWARVVGAESCGRERHEHGCCEFYRHLLAGTGVDYAEGVKARDPRSIGVYFSKHGAFSAKEYQNEAPPEWKEAGSVGRFWGVWGLEKAVAGVLVTPAEGIAAGRTLRRWSRANAALVDVPMWRYRTVVDPLTGEVTARWRKSRKRRRLYRGRDSRSAFHVVRDGPVLAASLARHLDQLYRPGSVVSRSGSGPVGFLP